MNELEPDYVAGVWVCPICGEKFMSKRVAQMHIRQKHPEEATSEPPENEAKSHENPGVHNQKPPKNEGAKNNKEKKDKGKNGKKGGITKRKFKLSRTEVRVWDYEHLDIKDHRSWQMFANRNYLASLHKQKVMVKLISGETYEGVLKARDPYFIALILEDGEKIYVNKAHILWLTSSPP